jgi:hypothetical protein
MNSFTQGLFVFPQKKGGGGVCETEYKLALCVSKAFLDHIIFFSTQASFL